MANKQFIRHLEFYGYPDQNGYSSEASCCDCVDLSEIIKKNKQQDKEIECLTHEKAEKKDPFYLYKAWWNPTPFVHICCKNYTKKADRVIKCYTNQTTQFALKVNGTTVETKTPSDNILTFTAHTFSSGDVVTVESGNISDTFTFE